MMQRWGSMPLARGHHSFVLTSGEDWGDESPFLHALARRLGGPRPPVLLVNGGEIAMAEVDRARASGSHLVVLAGSGRAADALAAAARIGTTGRQADREMSENAPTVIDLDDGVEALVEALRGTEPTAMHS